MARILPDNLVPNFLDAYGVTGLADDCSADQLTIKIWDKYGKKPEDGKEEATTIGDLLPGAFDAGYMARS